MQQYIYSTPQILTDAIFTLYGGQTGSSSPAQREIAYVLAEEQMVEYLNSYLTPTTVSGTYLWKGHNPLELGYGWIISVSRVSFNTLNGNGCTFDSSTGCFAIRNSQFGFLDVSKLVNCGGCGSILGSPPYTIDVVYESGLATGTYTSKSMLMALTIVAQINLNEIDVSLSNETTGDIGLEFFINQRYHEKRMKTYNTAFGNSAMASRAAKLVRKLRAKPSIGVH